MKPFSRDNPDVRTGNQPRRTWSAESRCTLGGRVPEHTPASRWCPLLRQRRPERITGQRKIIGCPGHVRGL